MRKLLTLSVVVATIAWSLGLAAVVPLASAAYSPSAGDLVKTASNPAVYYIDSEGARHLFSNEVTYWTWYSGTWATQGIKTISQDDFDDLELGGNVTARPGVKLIKFENSPKAYAVTPGAIIRNLEDEAAAKALYGDNWYKNIITIQNAFETNYVKGDALTSSSVMPDGSLVKYEGSEDIYYIEDGKKRLVTDDAFVANSFKDSAVITIATSMTFDSGSSITGEEAELSTVAGPESSTPTTPSGTSLSVSLASDTPASGLAVIGAIRVPFTTVSLTASADGDITVDSMTVERKSAAVDANFSSLALIDASTNVQIGTNQNLNASSKAVFSNDIVVKAGTTKKIILAGNIASSGSVAGQVPSLALSAMELKGGATVVGSLPITGNYQTVTSLTIGGVTVQRSSYQNSTSTDVKVGTAGYIVAAYKISSNSVEGQRIKQIKFYQSGTASLDDLTNYKLLADNSEQINATFTKDGKYLTADFTNSSVLVEKGKSKDFVLKADIESGSTRTIKFGIYRTTDVVASGDTFGYMMEPAYSGASSTATNPVLTNDQLTVSTGTLRIESSNAVPAQDVSYGDAQAIGSFTFVVQGEPVEITQLTLTSSSSTMNSTNIDNVKLVDSKGNTLWGPSTMTAGAVTYTATNELPVGSNVVKVVADLESTGGFANNETFYFYITGSSITATGADTQDAVTATPSGSINSYTQTFKPGKLTVTANSLPVSGNVSLGSKQALYGSWVFSAVGSGEDVKITAISLANQTATTTNLDSLSLYDTTNKTDCTTLYPTATLDSTYGCKLEVKDGYSGTTTWTLSTPIIVAKGKTVTLELRGDVRSTAATYQGHKDGFVVRYDGSTVPVTALGKVTGNTITPTGSAYNSQTPAIMTIAGAGSLTINVAASNPSSKIVAEGQTYEVGRLKLTATNEAINVSQLNVCVGNGALTGTATGDNGDVTNVKIYKSTDLSNAIVDTTLNAACEQVALATDLNVPTGSSGVELVIKATTAKVDNASIDETGASNASFKIGLGGTKYLTAKGATSGLTVSTITNSNATGTAVILHKAYPSVTVNSLSSTKLVASGGVLYDFTVSNPTSEAIAIYRLSFHVNTSTDANLMVTTSGLQAKRTDWSTFKQVAADYSANSNSQGGDTYPTFTMVDPDSLSTAKELVIGAGQSAQFQLIGRSVAGLDSDLDGSVQVRLLGDTASSTLATAYSNGAPAGAFSALEQGNFIWSDLYSSDTSAITTSQWYNGYLVNGLQATSTVVNLTE